LKPCPELWLVIGANLESPLLQAGTKGVDIRLHPERDERLSIGNGSLALLMAQQPP
jgi:hypothetical protein